MRIGIVEELPLTAQTLQQAVALNPSHQIIWTARSGADALERCRTDTPDLVMLDLLMADMDSSEIIRRIMAASPCAILIVTDSVPANAARVFDLMGCGALDAVDVPATTSANLEQVARPLLMKIDTIARLIGDTNGGRRSAGEDARRL